MDTLLITDHPIHAALAAGERDLADVLLNIELVVRGTHPRWDIVDGPLLVTNSN